MADDSTLWVGGLSDKVTEDLLFELFLQAGPLEKVIRPKEKDGTQKKFAFVEFRHPESVPYAMQVMDGISLFGQHLRLKARIGSQHDVGVPSPNPVHSHGHSPTPPLPGHPGQRGGLDFHRSWSYHGQDDRMRGPPPPQSQLGNGHPKAAPQRIGTGSPVDNRQPGFNGPVDLLSLPFNNMGSYTAPHMQPQSMDSRRARVLQRQALSLQAHSQRAAMNPYGGFNVNYAQSFNQGQQPRQQQPWYPNQPQQQQFY
ncbi:hypothetical protein BaRGS_00017229 [Batillaria attramentaria]|uniref:RRM domain-containing protein n=1 Tax=Batillaria attramentaria TaxID=370345 RepID=A0ABD0KXR2_9CAEN